MATSLMPELGYVGDPGNQGSVAGLSIRQRCELFRMQFETERSTFISHWQELSDFIFPRRARFYIADVNKGDKRFNKIIDSTATKAARTLAAGMMSGVSSPARPWFRLSAPDPDLNEKAEVKEYLHEVEERMHMVFAKSNFYKKLTILYGDIGVFGTGCISIEEDDKTVIRCRDFPNGTYFIGNDQFLQPRIFGRTFRLNVQQVVEKWGDIKQGKPDFMREDAKAGSRIPGVVQGLWKRKAIAAWVDIVHMVIPNHLYDESKFESRFKQYLEVYYIWGAGNVKVDINDETLGLLQTKGYDEFPLLPARWEVNSEDVYGTNCPGMIALGDIKEAQTLRKRGSQGLEKMINPPMTAPTNMRSAKLSLLPGEVNFQNIRGDQKGFAPAHEINFAPAMAPLRENLTDVRESIREAFYVDLFLQLSQSDRREITAREIDERHEEKLLALGPMLEQLDEDVFNPAIDRTFNIMNRKMLLPPPPPVLHGVTLKVEYISIMHQAQKQVALSAIERFAGFINQVAQTAPEVLDYIDDEELVRSYADASGVPPKLLRSPDAVAALRQARAKAQQQQQAAENVPKLAGAAKDLAQSPTGDGGNVLANLMAKATARRTIGATAGPPAPVLQ